ncbi:hypothetical protein DFJ73DRAFT_767874 [Zopfochytrium polystomum]|nr:hypothetical protein DFJ73DRAFT_767874 [Zopfochytrium polystomum]
MSLLLVSSAAAGQARLLFALSWIEYCLHDLCRLASKADPAPNGAGARRPKERNQTHVVVPEDPIPASLVSHFATNPTPASARVIVDQLPENARAVLRFLLGNNAVTPSSPPYSSAPPPAVEHTDNIGDASADNDEACDTYSVYEPSSPLVLPTSPTASEAVSPGNTAPVPTDPTVTVETSNSDNNTNIA